MHSVRKRDTLAIAFDGLGPDTQCLPPRHPPPPSPPAEGRLCDDLPVGDCDVLGVEHSEERCQEDERKEAQPDPVESVWPSSRTSERGRCSWPIWAKPPAQKENTTGDEPHPQTVSSLAHHQHDAVLTLLDRIAFSPTQDQDCLRAAPAPLCPLDEQIRRSTHRPSSGTERPRQILRTSTSEISVCLGTVSIAPVVGLVQRECARPSRFK
jgi:hypothetical protein